MVGVCISVVVVCISVVACTAVAVVVVACIFLLGVHISVVGVLEENIFVEGVDRSVVPAVGVYIPVVEGCTAVLGGGRAVVGTLVLQKSVVEVLASGCGGGAWCGAVRCVGGSVQQMDWV